MKKIILLIFSVLNSNAMQKPAQKIQTLRALCLEFIYKNKIPRTISTNNLLDQVQVQENIYEFYLSRELTTTSLTVLKSLIDRGVPVQNDYRILPAVFQKWRTSSIKKWKSAGALEPLTSLIQAVVENNLTNRIEILAALNLVIKEQPASYALPEFIIQVALNNDLSDYNHGNIVTFPPCRDVPSLELKTFMKTVIGAKLQPDLKNSMLRRAVHQKITHNQLEYEPIICCLIANGADKTILSSFEQNNILCATN